MQRKLTLILGGARSGKSSHAEQLAARAGLEANSGPVLYVATAEAHDAEMTQRIVQHRAQRPDNWITLEAPRHTGAAIAAFKPAPAVLLLDCITLLASNALMDLSEPYSSEVAEQRVNAEIDALLSAWRESAQNGVHWFVVSNETGLGLVPPYPLGRVYRDALGRANQTLASAADEVLFMIAGLPMKLK